MKLKTFKLKWDKIKFIPECITLTTIVSGWLFFFFLTIPCLYTSGTCSISNEWELVFVLGQCLTWCEIFECVKRYQGIS